MASRPRYSTHIRLDHSVIRDKKINPTACTFNTDIFVTDIDRWNKFKIEDQLKDWLNKTMT